MGILDGKRIVITGVLTDASLAFGTAQRALDEGAEIVLTGAGRGLSLTRRTARKLKAADGSAADVEVLELDVTVASHMDALVARLGERWGGVDGVVHAIGFAPASCLGDDFFAPTWEEVSTAVQISTYSLSHLAQGLRPLMQAAGGGSIVGLDFDASVAWPVYNWMGVAKAGLESLNRYLAKHLGADNIRCNLVAAGPIRSIAAKAIPGFERVEAAWQDRSPLRWDVDDTLPVANACVALLSDLFSKTTGSLVYVDGGVHAVGA